MNESQNPFDSSEQNGNASSPNAPQQVGQDPSQMPRNDVGTSPSGEGNVNSARQDQPQSQTQLQPAIKQPEYGQIKVPEYGAMASQFPANYNPYVYGKPDQTQQQNNNNGNQPRHARNGQDNQFVGNGNGMGQYQGNQNGQNNMPNGGFGQMPGNGYGNNQNYPYGQPYNNGQGMAPDGPGTPGYQPDYHNGIDMNDPAQNPLKGHWDPMAIVSIILLFFPMTFLPIITGAISMWRTKKYHMKGFWTATVCMVLGVIATLFELWLISKGVNLNDWMQQMLNQYTSGGSTGGGDGPVST
ncbi:hypothetical protein OZX73_03960 [Bifidobacterium sp. ESL0775]|uniref:hypothetical protein n=1 Tax=Bifidobacterium sp. ESL0775 TaxID=2983230 RepID=UPI0023F7E10D|nr:hypothetical protein [Bifidobacterium sp. ESL0775]WEV70019.1 hypothetical protein OZX73_03960 [Bifidobacterium sp. ESL0775]